MMTRKVILLLSAGAWDGRRFATWPFMEDIDVNRWIIICTCGGSCYVYLHSIAFQLSLLKTIRSEYQHSNKVKKLMVVNDSEKVRDNRW
jgi:hypothetical protein